MLLGWGGKDFWWGRKVRCNSAAKNHPSARHWSKLTDNLRWISNKPDVKNN